MKSESCTPAPPFPIPLGFSAGGKRLPSVLYTLPEIPKKWYPIVSTTPCYLTLHWSHLFTLPADHCGY